MQLQLHYTTLITLHHNYNSTTLQLQLQLHYTTLHTGVVGEVTHQVTTATIVTTQKKTQLQPPFSPSVDSLCHPWFTTTNLSYRCPIFETSATALCSTTGTSITVTIYIQVLPSATKLLLSLTFTDLLAAPPVSSAHEKIIQNSFVWCTIPLKVLLGRGCVRPALDTVRHPWHLNYLPKENNAVLCFGKEKWTSQILWNFVSKDSENFERFWKPLCLTG